jgi:enolase-phosphatase E1
VTRPVRHHARVVLLDIEGTTTPMAFVHDVLFPYARRRLADWCRRQSGADVYQEVLRLLAVEHAADRARGESVPDWHDGSRASADASLQAYAAWLMDIDRKSPGLKLLQGRVWEEGYRSGDLRGEVFPDVAPALRRWHGAGVRLAIYSSGSERAQRLLFSSTRDGDLTPLIAGFFDTGVGAKVSPESYARIQSELGVAAGDVVFVSDVTAELAAARQAGSRPVLCVRPGNRPQPDAAAYEAVSSFDELDVRTE